jgi:hypothetical protein
MMDQAGEVLRRSIVLFEPVAKELSRTLSHAQAATTRYAVQISSLVPCNSSDRVTTVASSSELVIFGVTETGGGANLGTVFEVLKSNHGYAFRLLHSFNGADGNAPLAR